MSPLESTAALLRHNLLLARREAAPLAVMVAMPLVLMAFLQPALRLSLQTEATRVRAAPGRRCPAWP